MITLPSPIDALYQKIFRQLPTKAGMAFERFAAIATRIITNRGTVTHDAVLRGEHSGTAFQVDIHYRDVDFQSMGEAKDYSAGGKKVGRDDVQKLVGALRDLDDIDSGVFWSATSYTKPARLYANASLKMNGKSVSLMGLKPSTPEDESGFVRTINVTARHLFPLLDQSKFTVHCTPEGQAMLFASAAPDEKKITVYARMQAIFNADGRIVTSLAELTRPGYAALSDDNVSRGCFCLPGLFMDCNGVRVPIHGIEYEVPFKVHTSRSEASTTSPYRLVIMDENDKPTQVLTDDNLKSYRFDEQKNVLP